MVNQYNPPTLPGIEAAQTTVSVCTYDGRTEHYNRVTSWHVADGVLHINRPHGQTAMYSNGSWVSAESFTG